MIMTLFALVAITGCDRPPPDLVAARMASEAWKRGVGHLDEGAPAEASAEFEQGLAARPGDVLLLAWRARAEAEAGRLDDAIATMDLVLAARRDFSEARYNRAAYLARAGRLDEAGRDLRMALDGGVTRPEDVLADPDFQRHLDHPALAFLPRQALKLLIESRKDSAFLASEVPVRLLVVGNDDAPVQLELTEISGPAEIVKVVQNTVQSTDGLSTELVWTLRITGAGSIRLGPWQVSSAGRGASHPGIAFEAVAPPDHVGSVPPLSGPLPVPEAIAGGHEDLDVWRAVDRTWVRTLPGDRVDPSPPAVVLERREGPRTSWLAHGFDTTAPGGRLTVSRGGRTVVDDVL
ncbi:MAG: hypothetical protein ACI8PZ_004688 [Myxococcota bacterium]|jgi:hypothetical protein